MFTEPGLESMYGEDLTAVSKKHSAWSLYPVPLLAFLVVLLLYVFFFAPVTVTLDGYSHLYGGKALSWMLGGQPEAHRNYSYNSPLLPNWLCALFLAVLSNIVSNELALKLLIVLTGMALLFSLYFCIDGTLYNRHQRAQVLIVLLPFALNAYLTSGFFGFLISSSLCLFVLGLLLRHGLSMPLRFKLVVGCLLLVAYFSNPLPVIISFLFPCAYFIVEAIFQWRDGWRRSATALTRHAFDIWPWVAPACIVPWFYLRLSKAVEPHTYSVTFNLLHRSVELSRDALVAISPTPSVGTLFVVLLSLLLGGMLLCSRKMFEQDRLRFTSLTVLIVSTLVLYVFVPDEVGDAAEIANRFLLHAAFFLVLLALTSGVFEARFLTLCSLVAALSVVGFAGEYLNVSKSLAPAVDELGLGLESVPRHSRILILGYRMTPSCKGLPLLERTIPERHWALASTLKNELIVLNDYQGNTSHFPLKYLRSRLAVINEVDLRSERQRAAWFEILKTDPEVDFVVSWGTPSGITRLDNTCTNSVDPPFEEALKIRYDLAFFKKGTSRVELWRKRG
jgi:hypothetical protein